MLGALPQAPLCRSVYFCNHTAGVPHTADNEGHNRKQVDDLQKRVQDTEQELLSVIANANGRETDLRFQIEKEQGERLALERKLVEMNEQMAEVASMNWREGLRYGRQGVRATPGRLPPPTPRKGVQL